MTAATSLVSLPCSSCELSHRWTTERAGRRARCRCGNVIRFPAAAPSADGSPPLDLLPLEEAPTTKKKPVRAPRRRSSTRRVGARSHRAGQRTHPAGRSTLRRQPIDLRSPVAMQKREKSRDLHALILLGIGAVVYIGAELRAASILNMQDYTFLHSLGSAALLLAVGTMISLLTATIVGSFLFRTSFGALGTATKKFGALILLTNGLALLAGAMTLSMSGLVAIAAYVCVGWVVYFGLLMSLFDMRVQEAFVFAFVSRVVESIVIHTLVIGALGLFLIRAL
jgi:hypothetical protein